jgi:ADP-heptose:LPS heptosyltransferase
MHRPDLKRFYPNTRDAKKIIVVDLGFLGDTVHLVPALWEIKAHYPQAELQVLSSPLGCEVLQMVRCVDRAWSFPLGPPSPGWWEHWGILRELRRERFDAAFNFSGADRSVIATILIGARETMAYGGARQHFWQPWLIRHWIPRLALPTPAYEGRRHLLALCGLDLKPARFDLMVPEGERKWARENIPDRAVHLSLSASFALKEWPMANNVKLTRLLLDGAPGRSVVVSAAPKPREESRLGQLRREISDARLKGIGGRLPVARLAAVLERCAMHVGPDSGVIHLASALGIATVSIFRRYANMAEFLPVGPKHVYFEVPCPCMGTRNPSCATAGEAACLAGISPELVAKEILGRLALADSAAEQ